MTATLARIAAGVARGRQVRAGFLEGAPGYEDGQTPAQVAFLNEFGTSRIPARPFFSTMVREESPGWGQLLGRFLKASDYDGGVALGKMGQRIKERVQASIVSGKWAANAESTIARKGSGKTTLIDTRHMRDSVDFEVTT